MRSLRLLCAALALAAAALPGVPLQARAQSNAPKPSSKIASVLEQMMEACAQASIAGTSDLSPISNGLARVSARGEIELIVHARGDLGSQQQKDLRALGVRIETELLPDAALPTPAAEPALPGMAHAWVPWDRLRAVAALDWVAALTSPDAPVLQTGLVQAEGVMVQGAQAALARGINGMGVPIGVVSDGVTPIQASLDQGELPVVQVLAPGMGNEGVAMLEIIHDVAPGAPLLFHGSGANEMTHRNALMRLVQAGAKVITEDLGFLGQPVFQQGMLAMTGDMIAAGGVSFHSSSGNTGAMHAARVPAVGTGRGPEGRSGPFQNCGRNPPTNAVAIAPNGDTTFDVVLGEKSRFFLQWSEPRAIFPTQGQGGFTDLDLFVMDATGTRCLARSAGPQAMGQGDTLEAVATPAAMKGMRAKLVVSAFGSFGAQAPPLLDLAWVDAQAMDTPTRAGSLNPDANFLGLATSSGAVRAQQLALEPFSSAGPIQLGLTTLGDGSRGPGPTMTAMAPTFASVDGVSISGAGGFPVKENCPAKESGKCRFFGTSAAAPQSAACAALVLQALGPNTPTADVNRRLAETAVDDTANKGPDNFVGFGLIDCMNAPMMR